MFQRRGEAGACRFNLGQSGAREGQIAWAVVELEVGRKPLAECPIDPNANRASLSLPLEDRAHEYRIHWCDRRDGQSARVAHLILVEQLRAPTKIRERQTDLAADDRPGRGQATRAAVLVSVH